MLVQRVLFDDHARPHLLEEILLRRQVTLALHQRNEQIERPGRERNRRTGREEAAFAGLKLEVPEAVPDGGWIRHRSLVAEVTNPTQFTVRGPKSCKKESENHEAARGVPGRQSANFGRTHRTLKGISDMREPIRILLQTTIPETADDWHVGRFSLLRGWLQSQRDEAGTPLFEVTARNRQGVEGDPVLSTLDNSEFDELWLLAVDVGDGLPPADCAGISRFHRRGGGLLTARDHQDLGSSICDLGRVGRAHFFHTRNREPDDSRQVPDDRETGAISWPNYHSGHNGDFQKITPCEPVHELLLSPSSPSGVVEFFPAHPHEGAVGVPTGEPGARVIATGQSLATGRRFNLAVAFERAADEHGNMLGRAVAESSFHHFVDYNWDLEKGCPSFVTEPCGDAVTKYPARLDDVKTYVRNLALWLAPGAR